MISRPWLFTLTFLAFPPAGLVARAIVGPIDSVVAALVGGALVGGVVGLAQWAVLREIVRPWWIAVTSAAISFGLAATAALGLVSTQRGDLLAIGAVVGVSVGVAQSFLMPSSSRIRWAVAVSLLWTIAWQVTAVVGVDLTQGWAVFGASGALVFAAALAGVLATSSRRQAVEVAA